MPPLFRLSHEKSGGECLCQGLANQQPICKARYFDAGRAAAVAANRLAGAFRRLHGREINR